MKVRKGGKLLVNTMTMVDGEVLPHAPESPLQPWATHRDGQAGKVLPVRPVQE